MRSGLSTATETISALISVGQRKLVIGLMLILAESRPASAALAGAERTAKSVRVPPCNCQEASFPNLASGDWVMDVSIPLLSNSNTRTPCIALSDDRARTLTT